MGRGRMWCGGGGVCGVVVVMVVVVVVVVVVEARTTQAQQRASYVCMPDRVAGTMRSLEGWRAGGAGEQAGGVAGRRSIVPDPTARRCWRRVASSKWCAAP